MTTDEDALEPDFSGLPEMARRLARHIDRGRGIQLSPAELDLLVLTGAYEVLSFKVAQYHRRQAESRIARRG